MGMMDALVAMVIMAVISLPMILFGGQLTQTDKITSRMADKIGVIQSVDTNIKDPSQQNASQQINGYNVVTEKDSASDIVTMTVNDKDTLNPIKFYDFVP